ncbi:hypothetical protein AB0M28_14940 [Streptomyces sp. NPDC051940]|uniref:hypothetical protein n=1 Tax=Streptomyces sp. NPDC051940 TaxID=3155675 RepID=UPI00343069A2
MIRTTPAQRAPMLAAFPELHAHGRTAVRLHPRPGSPTARESSVGGPLLWPAGEPWPVCEEAHPADDGHDHDGDCDCGQYEMIRQAIASVGAAHTLRPRYERPARPVPMVPVLQLFRADAPGAPFPSEDVDLLQILWCPERHEELNEGPRPVVFWRRSADVAPGDGLPAEPGSGRHIPVPCVLHPEELTEFPWLSRGYGSELGPSPVAAALEQRVQEWNAGQPRGYDYHALAISPGWKAGGWDLLHPECGCGATMVTLFQTSQYEYLDGCWTPHGEPDLRWGDPQDRADQQPTGVTIGDELCLTVHICPADAGHPVRTTVN